MKKMFGIFVGIILILLIITAIVSFFKKPPFVKINGQKFQVELALTESQREKGLSDRDHLDVNAGMLFVFPKSDIQSFWMKDTKIPLDIVWINDNKIVEMTTLEPQKDNTTPQYTPENNANYVLELNAGTASKYNFKIGDEAKIKY